MINTEIIFVILVLIRLLATGIREGLRWTDYDWDQWYLDYHFIRTIDIAIFAIFLSYILGFWLALGTLMFGYCLIYERALQYIDHKQLFYEQSPWKIFGYEIPFTNTFMVITGLIGLIIILIEVL